MVSRAYCWTLNNYTVDDTEQLAAINLPVKGICWGREVGESGTPHLQGYVEFTKPMRIGGIKKLGGAYNKMHLEVRRGTREEAMLYCGKEAPLEEHGDLKSSQGARNDLDKARKLAAEDGMRAVTLTCSMQQIRVAEKFLSYHEEPRDWECDVRWYWGDTGAGKSREARINFEHTDFFVKNEGSKWWDGYDGHEGVIIDDFRGNWWPLTEMLSLLDRYEKRVEVKGGWRQFKPRVIIITSPFPPERAYPYADEDGRQLLRRIGSVTRFRNEVGGVILDPPPLVTAPEVADEDFDELLAGFI